jgi:hypothetical protein
MNIMLQTAIFREARNKDRMDEMGWIMWDGVTWYLGFMFVACPLGDLYG